MHSTMHLYPINGAAQRVGKGDTAFSFRDANFAEVIVGVDPDPANNERMIQWARDYWLALHPYSAGGGYVNMMMDEGEDKREGGLPRQLRAAGADQGASTIRPTCSTSTRTSSRHRRRAPPFRPTTVTHDRSPGAMLRLP